MTNFYLDKDTKTFHFKDFSGKPAKLSVGDIIKFTWDPGGEDIGVHGLVLNLSLGLANACSDEQILKIGYLDLSRNQKNVFQHGIWVEACYLLRLITVYELQETHSET